MSSMTEQQFREAFEALLEVEPGTIKGEESLDDLAGWDSMASLSFIAMADSELGTLVSIDSLVECKSVADLINLFPGKISQGQS